MKGRINRRMSRAAAMSMRMIAVIIVMVLVVGAIAGVVLLASGGNNNGGGTGDNWLDNGFKLEVFYNAGNTNRQYQAELLKAGLESLNPGKIQITTTAMEWSRIIELQQQDALPCWVIGWAPDYADPDDYTFPFYHSGGTYGVVINYNNDTLDQKVTAAGGMTNATDREAAYRQMEWDAYNESLYIWTAQPNNFQPIRDNVSGYFYNPMFSNLIYKELDKTNNNNMNAQFVYENIGESDPDSLDPAVDYETAGGEVIQNVYDTLVFYAPGSTSELVPVLCTEVPNATNGGVSADAKTYTFHLKNNVQFSDGTPMTAADVKYSFDRILELNDPNSPAWMVGVPLFGDAYWNYGMANMTGTFSPEITQAMMDEHVWAKDATTVQFNLTSPSAAFNYIVAFNGFSIVSKKYVQDNGGLSQAGFTYMNSHMMGTGPYKFVEFVSGDHILLTRNDNYWGEKPAIKDVLIKQVPDESTRVGDLLAGNADAIDLPRASRADVDNKAGIKVYDQDPTFNIDAIMMNQKINSTAVNSANTNVPSDFFKDINVRKAFAHAFDYGKYIDQKYKGNAKQPNGAIPFGMFGYPSDVPTYNYSLDLAKQYLKAAKVSGTSSQAPLTDYSAAMQALATVKD